MPNFQNRQQAFQASFQKYMQDRPVNSVFAGFGDFTNKGAKKGANKPTTPTTPPPSQWTFQPNPLDQPPTGQPATAPGNTGSANGYNPWAVSPPIQPWMFNPAAGGWGNYGGMNWMPQGLSQLQPNQQPQIGGPLPPYQPSRGQF